MTTAASGPLHRRVTSTDPSSVFEHRDGPIVRHVLTYIDSHYPEAISLRDVARAVGYSPCHLTTTVRLATGIPVTAWIIKRRIDAAQFLLATGEVSVADACGAVGFNNLCYFTRQFVRHVGITPGRFRSLTNNLVSPPREQLDAGPSPP